MKSIYTILVINLLFFNYTLAQKIELQRVEPMHWWAGMKNPELQLLVYGKDMGYAKVSLSYPGVELKEVVSAENKNYLFLYVNISPTAKAGTFPIKFTFGKQEKTYQYELKARKKEGTAYKGFDNSDVIYLLFPDRFANGDEKNDNVAGMLQTVNRKDNYARHGGDLKGVSDHLDYLADLGFTAIWFNPVFENDMGRESYHGYAITDYYKIDRRFGTNESFEKLVERCHQKGIKVILDMVFNHCGLEHWFIKDLPFKDWIHQFPEFTRSNYRLATNIDPYTSQFDAEKMTTGWFDKTMPDLNQRNKHLGIYLIQNSIWWVEQVGLDGIRMDTHPYPYKDFMAKWLEVLLNEYPNFNVVGEIWEENLPAAEAYFQKGNNNKDGYRGNLPSVTDFPMWQAFNAAFNEKDEWAKGLARMYYVLANDIIYANPFNNLIFLDNHDASRFATVVNKNLNKMKMGFAALLTLRGIPQIFYGTEIMLEGPGSDHGLLRNDFPGGWKGDTRNAFSKEGRTVTENEIFEYLKKILNWRKNKAAVHTGKLMQFIPEEGIYVYFRYTDKESIMVVLNNNEEAKTLNTKRFTERLKGFSSGTNVITDEKITDLSNLNLPARSATILELK